MSRGRLVPGLNLEPRVLSRSSQHSVDLSYWWRELLARFWAGNTALNWSLENQVHLCAVGCWLSHLWPNEVVALEKDGTITKGLSGLLVALLNRPEVWSLSDF